VQASAVGVRRLRRRLAELEVIHLDVDAGIAGSVKKLAATGIS
jgi:hypothetical protein